MQVRSDFYVYLLFRQDGRPCYVGKGTGDRWRRHEMKGRHPNLHLARIIASAKGEPLPRIKLAEELPEEAAFQLERDMIRLIGRDVNGGPLVNLTDGGDGPAGYKPSAELIARQVEARKGWRHTAESKAKLSAALKGRPKSPEHIANVAARLRGNKKSSGWWSTEEGRAKQRANNKSSFQKGHRHSPETIEKIRAARSRQINVCTAGLSLGRKPKATANQGEKS